MPKYTIQKPCPPLYTMNSLQSESNPKSNAFRPICYPNAQTKPRIKEQGNKRWDKYPTFCASHSPQLPLISHHSVSGSGLVASSVAVSGELGLGVGPAHNGQASGVNHGNKAKDTQRNIGVLPILVSCDSLVVEQGL